ncbi:cytochrome-c oxidase, cbb3-type subunit III [Paracoccus suum]|uniref:Cbb3-type cytochrome c oxidase subunit n=1 Tax=Paracoccus suum TaxID=2259340 RepID=A0A344PME5_9RHOB|nr:cytochrome-c oxidase, cbb3-type subunit III [Paracoccus suum]AXC50550.1 cytochrome-c oxidase, cbb3-type subunit III [Paracoccus suum]
MSVKERDPLTGHQTTGHEWDGITELNTRVPRAVWWAVGLTHLWAVIVWVLLPTWPLVTTYTKGLLGLTDRGEVDAAIVQANAARADWADPVLAMPVDEIRADDALIGRVRQTGHSLFGDNCAGCHGRDARGGPGFPNLIDGDWLWGGDPDTIIETLNVGINSTHPDTRTSQMMAFGRDGMLTRPQILSVIGHIRALSRTDAAPSADNPAGAEIYADNCASCHGDDGRGMEEIGAPNLTDNQWIYGGDDDSVYRTIWGGRQGWMPSWQGRLSPTEIKILTTYLLDAGAQ